jgi:enoyl-CoA hydratase
MGVVQQEIEGRVATVTLNSPSTFNAMSSAVLTELLAVVEGLAQRGDIGAVILTGAGEKAFVAGADIKEMSTKSAIEGRAFAELGQRLTTTLEKMPQPVIAAVNGFALGGGCEIALACDIRICSENARFGQLEINLGIMPGWGGTQRLSRICGPGFAKELIYTGRMAVADEALRWGLVNAVYPLDELMDRAREMATTIASKSGVIQAFAKQALQRAYDQDLAGGLQLEADLFGLCFATDDQKEGMAAFLEKRAPEFGHR